MIIGFSTGCLYRTKKYHRVSKEIVEAYRSLGCNAIEFNCIQPENFAAILETIRKEDLSGFTHVSIHAPAFGRLGQEEIENSLELAQRVFEKLEFDNFVVHPDEVADWKMFSGYSLPISIENMDNRKLVGATVESMEEIFKAYDAPMTLDLNHCYANDPSMKLAYGMVDKFKSRINEIHLSGCDDKKQPSCHDPLYQTRQEEIMRVMPVGNIPIIIESVVSDMEEAGCELEYIKNNTKKRKI